MPATQSATSSTARKSSRPASKARNELLAQLKDDHQRVKKAYNKYRRLDAQDDAEMRQELVQLVLDELSVHARLEEELLYPAAREQLEDRSQIEEAQVEHEMLHILIDQLRDLDPEDETHEEEQHARFTVLCEYTLHHVKEEEREMFPQLMKVKLDWQDLAREFEERRAELKGESDGEEDEDDMPEEGADDDGDAAMAAGEGEEEGEEEGDEEGDEEGGGGGGDEAAASEDEDEDTPGEASAQAPRGAGAGRKQASRRGGSGSR